MKKQANSQPRKRRAPIEQLRKAGALAKEMLIKKGFMSKESLADLCAKTPNAPILPGIPEYLPHRFTIKISQRMMYNLLVIWRETCKGDIKKIENITEFAKFVIKEMKKGEKKLDKKVEEMSMLIKTIEEVPVLKDIFDPVRQREVEKGMSKFFIDSFAVAVIVKKQDNTSEFAEWFLDWTENMYELWGKQNDGLENKFIANENTNNN